MIRLIAAIDAKRGLATDAGIPWNLPGDVAHFRERTTSGAILMGRSTYDEFASPLHGGDNYVLTRTAAQLRPGFRPVAGLGAFRAEHGDDDVWIIGGAATFSQAIVDAAELHLTQVQGDFRCTKFFPPYDRDFTLADKSGDHIENAIEYRFETWKRTSEAPWTDPSA